jgi:membrane-associated phospholipid phosphatase
MRVSRAVARRETAPLDAEVHEQTAIEPDHPARQLAEAASPIGKWWTYVPAAVLAAAYVAASGERRSRVAGMAAIVTAASAATALSHVFDDLLPQPPAPPGRPTRDHPVFPSGHAFGTMSVALMAAYVITREAIAHAAIVYPLALAVPIASSAGRLIEEKHWISDIGGGYLAALALTAAIASAYEATRCEERTGSDD